MRRSHRVVGQRRKQMMEGVKPHSQRRPQFSAERIADDRGGVEHLFPIGHLLSLAEISMGAELPNIVQGRNQNEDCVDAYPAVHLHYA